MKAGYIKQALKDVPDDQEVACWFELFLDVNDYRFNLQGKPLLTESQWGDAVERFEKVQDNQEFWELLLETVAMSAGEHELG